jgi:hypothetical protein
VLVFYRAGGGGHVGLYVAEDPVAFHVLGGNEADQVNIVRVDKRRFAGARRPAYSVQPSSVRAYHAVPAGGLSGNEA